MPVKEYSLKNIVAVLITLLVLLLLLPLEYDNIRAKSFIYPLMWIGAVYLVFKAFPKKHYVTRNLLLIFLGLFGFFVILPRVIGFCGWTHHGTLYVKKGDKSIRLVCRSYECYMTDGPCQLFKERRITKHLKWVTSFGEESVDKTIWEEVSSMSTEYD